MLKVLPRTHREHSLTGRITLEALHRAFKAVKRNRGAAGLDKQTIKMFEANLDENLLALMRELKSGTYQPIPLRRVYIPKGKGAVRPLGIPAVRCRVAQEVIRALITPIFEPTFHDSSHGFRRHRSCHTAMAQLAEPGSGRFGWRRRPRHRRGQSVSRLARHVIHRRGTVWPDACRVSCPCSRGPPFVAVLVLSGVDETSPRRLRHIRTRRDGHLHRQPAGATDPAVCGTLFR